MDWRRASDVRERWSHTPTTVAYRPQVGPAMIAFAAAAAVALPVPTHSLQGEPFPTRRKREQVLLLFMAGRPPSLPCRIPILPLAVGVSARTPFSLGLAPDADLEAQEGAFQGLEKANATKASETVAGQSSRRTSGPLPPPRRHHPPLLHSHMAKQKKSRWPASPLTADSSAEGAAPCTVSFDRGGGRMRHFTNPAKSSPLGFYFSLP
ncbi:hypothetical protein BHE74_00040838 [Ensete ventricosum]|nr:hypothetical protein BHE74_00040838 [Ensete ventricosum]